MGSAAGHRPQCIGCNASMGGVACLREGPNVEKRDADGGEIECEPRGEIVLDDQAMVVDPRDAGVLLGAAGVARVTNTRTSIAHARNTHAPPMRHSHSGAASQRAFREIGTAQVLLTSIDGSNPSTVTVPMGYMRKNWRMQSMVKMPSMTRLMRNRVSVPVSGAGRKATSTLHMERGGGEGAIVGVIAEMIAGVIAGVIAGTLVEGAVVTWPPTARGPKRQRRGAGGATALVKRWIRVLLVAAYGVTVAVKTRESEVTISQRRMNFELRGSMICHNGRVRLQVWLGRWDGHVQCRYRTLRRSEGHGCTRDALGGCGRRSMHGGTAHSSRWPSARVGLGGLWLGLWLGVWRARRNGRCRRTS